MVAAIVLRPGIFTHSRDVDHYHGFIAHNPGVVARRHKGHIAWPELRFGAIIHDDMKPAGDMICEVGCLATLCLYQRLDASVSSIFD